MPNSRSLAARVATLAPEERSEALMDAFHAQYGPAGFAAYVFFTDQKSYRVEELLAFYRVIATALHLFVYRFHESSAFKRCSPNLGSLYLLVSRPHRAHDLLVDYAHYYDTIASHATNMRVTRATNLKQVRLALCEPSIEAAKDRLGRTRIVPSPVPLCGVIRPPGSRPVVLCDTPFDGAVLSDAVQFILSELKPDALLLYLNRLPEMQAHRLALCQTVVSLTSSFLDDMAQHVVRDAVLFSGGRG